MKLLVAIQQAGSTNAMIRHISRPVNGRKKPFLRPRDKIPSKGLMTNRNTIKLP